MNPTTPPGTVPLMFGSNQIHEYHGGCVNVLGASFHCVCERNPPCYHIGFRVVDEAVFNEWLEKLRMASTLGEWKKKRRKDEASC